MQNKLKFISFYSMDTVYEESFNTKLLPSLVKWDLDFWVKPIKNLGKWYLNTMQKPAIILEALYKFNRDLVYVDADAEIRRFPQLLYKIPAEYDIGVHYLSWADHYGRPSDKGKYELIDGTIFVRNNEKMKAFIKQWKANSTDIGKNHQRPLERMLRANKDIKVFDFGRTYCYIEKPPRMEKPAVEIKDPHIIHYQQSRTARRRLK